MEVTQVEHLDGVEDDSDGSGSYFLHIRDSKTGSSTNSDFTYLTTSEKFDNEDEQDQVDVDRVELLDEVENEPLKRGAEHLDGVAVDLDGSGSDFVHIRDSETSSSTNSDFAFLATSKKFDDEDEQDQVDGTRVEHLGGVEVDSDGSGSNFVHTRDSKTGSRTNSDFTFLTKSEKLDDNEVDDKLDVARVEHLDVAEVDSDGSGSNFVHIPDSETGSSTNSDFTFLTTSEKLDDEVEVGNDHDTDVETGDDHHDHNPENQNGVYNVAPIDYFFISNWSQ